MSANWRDRLRQAIRESGMTQSLIARRAGIAPETLSRILSGNHSRPEFSTIVRIARAVRASVGWLLQERGYAFNEEQVKQLRKAAAIITEAMAERPK
jgi:transcriptional regulator with XRE-family HTH domain